MTDDETPKLQIDSDWKAEAQAEKERLAQKEAEKQDQPEGPTDLPDPDFRSIIGVLASPAVMGLGTMADPRTGSVMIDLVGAKFHIDLLETLEQKTKGNLSDEEGRELTQILAELRSRFVQVSDLVAQQAATAAPDAGAGPSQIHTP